MSAGVSVAAIVAGVKANRQKVLNPMSQDRAQAILNETWYIFNIRKGHAPVTVHRSWGGVTVPAASESEEYSVTPVHGRIERLDAGIEDTFVESVTTAQEAAQDIANWFNNDCPSLETAPGIPSFNGVFIASTPEPPKSQLAEAARKMKAYDHALVGEADNLWGTEATRKNISTSMREAARRQNVKKPWLYEVKEMSACFACGSQIMPNVILCPECKVVQPGKEAEARKHFPEKFAYERQPKTS